MGTEGEKQQQGQETDQRPVETASGAGLAPKGGTLFSLSPPYLPSPTALPREGSPPHTTPGTASYSQL